MSEEIDPFAMSSNALLEGLANEFVSGNLDDFPVSRNLEIERLDYSIGSLEIVDTYLTKVRKNFPRESLFGKRSYEALSNSSKYALILRLGCYLGEVIRRNSTVIYDWCIHSEILAKDASNLDYVGEKPSLVTLYGLVSRQGLVCLPLNKVFKFLINGPEIH